VRQLFTPEGACLAVALQSNGQGRFRVGSKDIRCPMCEGEVFEQRRGVLDTRGATFFGWSWLNRGSTELICRGCHFLMTFAD